jgi:hypothetical protein
MPFTFPKPRLPWIALAAFLGAALASGGASASCTSMPDAGACPPICGCCKASQSDWPTDLTGRSATVDQHILYRVDANACRPSVSVGGCSCRPQAPAAPGPRGQRTGGENRPETELAIAAGWSELSGGFRPAIAPISPTASPPQKSPLYLRTSRLLI